MSKDPKTELKELVDKGAVPHATFASRRAGGLEHKPGWEATVTLSDGTTGTGVGPSKRAAEASAAEVALHKIKTQKP